MLTSSEIKFTFIFAIILLAELIFGSFESLYHLHYFTKPLIVIALIGFALKHATNLKKSIKQLLVGALTFSLLGDILLLFVGNAELFFILGLVAFLMAHIVYCILFFRQRDKHNKKKKPFAFAFVLILYAAMFMSIIYESLGSLFIPVAYYVIVISTMALMAYSRKGNFKTINYNLVFLGALLFVASDSILALNKFHETIAHNHIWIMLTYALAQYCITMGVLKSSKT